MPHTPSGTRLCASGLPPPETEETRAGLVVSPCPGLSVSQSWCGTRRAWQTGCDGTNVPPRLGGSGQEKRPYCPMWTGCSLLYHVCEPGRDKGGRDGERTYAGHQAEVRPYSRGA